MLPWAHNRALLLTSVPSGALFLLKYQMNTMVFFPSRSLLHTKIKWLSSSWASISFIPADTKSNLLCWLVASLKLKVSFPSSMLDTRAFLKLGRLYGEELDIYSWCVSLDAKHSVFERMYLVEVMATDVKRSTSPNVFGMPLLFCLYLINLLCLNPEMGRFAYSGMRREDCEGTSWSSPLDETSVATSRLTSVVFCSPLGWFTWWICPPWSVPSLVKYSYLVKGLRVSKLAYVPCSISWSSFVSLEAVFGEGPAAASWGSSSRG